MSNEAELYKFPKGWINTHLGEVISLEYGKSLSKANRLNGKYPVFGSNGIIGKHDKYLIEGPAIIVGRKGAVGAVHLSMENCWPISHHLTQEKKNIWPHRKQYLGLLEIVFGSVSPVLNYRNTWHGALLCFVGNNAHQFRIRKSTVVFKMLF